MGTGAVSPEPRCHKCVLHFSERGRSSPWLSPLAPDHGYLAFPGRRAAIDCSELLGDIRVQVLENSLEGDRKRRQLWLWLVAYKN